ncbi:MAG: DJ-1/PfpI family protein [Chitinophagaceae bacterium]|nr:DJ-1/PfpI family protein [Chitinophagaceae bacterium]
MKKNVGILIFDDAEVLDFAGPFEVFSVTSQINDYELFNVFTIAKNTEPVVAVNGLLINPSYTFSNHPTIDILIISGGQGTRKLVDDNTVMSWVEEIHRKTELTISICSGSRLLGKLGLLNNKPFCTHKAVYEQMEEIAPLAIPQKDKRFVQSDKRIYTSGGISAGIDLSFHIVESLFGKKIAESTAEYMEYAVTV